jgi:hypothetical protein
MMGYECRQLDAVNRRISAVDLNYVIPMLRRLLRTAEIPGFSQKPGIYLR